MFLQDVGAPTPILDSLEQPEPWMKAVRTKRVDPNWLKLRNISEYGLAASADNTSKEIYKRNQYLQMAHEYHNNGTVRTMVNKRTDYILGNRTKWMIEANDIIPQEDMSPEEQQALETIMTGEEVKKLRRDINRVNKQVQLHDKLTQLVINNFVFGRSLGGIDRKITPDFPKIGEPRHLKVLNTIRIKKVEVDENSGEFNGYRYDFGLKNKSDVFLPAIKLLPMWYNDSNIYDNTPYQGMSAIWSVLGMAQNNNFINDEDLPEACKTSWSPYGFVYVGDKSEETTAKLRKKVDDGTLLFHNQEKLRLDVANMSPNMKALWETRLANMKAMCIDFGFPMFLLFEDTANFATANQVMQAYRAGVLERDRTWLRGILEKYWYDPMLMDHIPEIKKIEDLWKANIKISAAFEDINFETKKEIVEGDEKLVNLGVYDVLDVAKDIDARPEVIERLEKLEPQITANREAFITNKVDERDMAREALKQKGEQAKKNNFGK